MQANVPRYITQFVSLSEAKDGADFCINLVSDFRPFITIIREILQGGTDSIPLSIGEHFAENLSVGGVHDLRKCEVESVRNWWTSYC